MAGRGRMRAPATAGTLKVKFELEMQHARQWLWYLVVGIPPWLDDSKADGLSPEESE